MQSGFVYLQDNPTYSLQYPCFDMTNIPKYKWEVWLKMCKSVAKRKKYFTQTSKKNCYEQPVGIITDFPDPRKILSLPPLPSGLYPTTTCLE